MSSWDGIATISTFLTHKHLSSASTKSPPGQAQAFETPVLGLLADARSRRYDAICIPLTTEKWKTRWEEMCLLPTGEGREAQARAEQRAEKWRERPGFLKDEVTITRLDEAEGATVMISEWLELDATDDWVRHDSEIALQQELAYASYLNVQSAILPAPRNREHVASYARIVNSCLKNTPYINLSIRLPIYNPSVLHPSPSTPAFPSTPPRTSLSGSSSLSPVSRTPKLVISDSAEKLSATSEGELNATWEMWDLIRSICDYNTRLTLTLDLTPPLPTTLGVLSKWAAESVRNIFLPASTFIANTKGYPVLPKPTQSFIRECMIHHPTFILSDASAALHTRGGEPAYSQYIRHLEKTSPAIQAAQKPGTVENFAQGYQDYLQAPLQPLMDNLQSVTYQTFEQDPVKYSHYEEAMYRALMDFSEDEIAIFCVAGAGRGPLVARCLAAIERSKRTAFIYAVEKNPNAFVTLQHRQEHEWGSTVKLLFGDMRFMDVPEKADFLVSELLGSFGDNELSPECLDGAMRFLKSDGVSIPSSYTAHLAPLSSSKLYNEARSTKDLKGLETPYVVMFQAVNILSGDGGGLSGNCGPQIQECWEFEHPRSSPVLDFRGLPTTNSHNARSAKLNFHIPHAGVLHGLAGYFEAVLYGNIGLSIHPHRKDQVSKDMLSWFPLFFPFKVGKFSPHLVAFARKPPPLTTLTDICPVLFRLVLSCPLSAQEPLYLPSNAELQVSIWRLTNERHVWYEWHAESFLSMPGSSVTPSSVSSEPGALVKSGSLGSTGLHAGSPSMGMASPLVDAVDMSFSEMAARSGSGVMDGGLGLGGKGGREMVKIGQTSLHNPNGRSSWIGL